MAYYNKLGHLFYVEMGIKSLAFCVLFFYAKGFYIQMKNINEITEDEAILNSKIENISLRN